MASLSHNNLAGTGTSPRESMRNAVYLNPSTSGEVVITDTPSLQWTVDESGQFPKLTANVNVAGLDVLPADRISPAAGMPRLLFSMTGGSNVVQNTTTETAFQINPTIPPGMLSKAGGLVTVRASGVYSDVGGIETLRIRMKIGTTTGITGVSFFDRTLTPIAGAQTTEGWFANGTFVVQTGLADLRAIHPAYGELFFQQGGQAGNSLSTLSNTPISLSVPQIIQVTAQWSVANAGDVIIMEHLEVWYTEPLATN